MIFNSEQLFGKCPPFLTLLETRELIWLWVASEFLQLICYLMGIYLFQLPYNSAITRLQSFLLLKKLDVRWPYSNFLSCSRDQDHMKVLETFYKEKSINNIPAQLTRTWVRCCIVALCCRDLVRTSYIWSCSCNLFYFLLLKHRIKPSCYVRPIKSVHIESSSLFQDMTCPTMNILYWTHKVMVLLWSHNCTSVVNVHAEVVPCFRIENVVKNT